MESRVRDAKAGLVDLRVAVQEQVEVERPWALRKRRVAPAAEALLDRKQDVEQVARGELRIDCGHPVEEARLVDDSYGLGVDQPGDCGDGEPGLRLERVERRSDRGLAFAEIRPESDVRARHGPERSGTLTERASPPVARPRRGVMRPGDSRGRSGRHALRMVVALDRR